MNISPNAYGFVKKDSLGNEIAMAVSKDGKIKEFKMKFKTKPEIQAQDILDMCDKK